MKENITLTFSKLTELSKRYSVKQIAAIYDPDFDVKDTHTISSTYKKADKLNDYEVINLLHQKYDMMAILDFDSSGLPESTMKEANRSFEEIYKFVNEVVPEAHLDRSLKRWHDRKINNCERMYGGKSLRGCFEIKKNGSVVFHVRKYLFRTSNDNARMVAKNLGYPEENIYDPVPVLIDWTCKQPGMKNEIIKLLLTMPDKLPIPIEDISDMMCGKIQMTI